MHRWLSHDFFSVSIQPQIENFPDSAVDEAMDLALRELLSTCFTKAQDDVFRHRRYFNEMPAHRWVIRDEEGALVAHLAVHEKQIFHAAGSSPIGGIAEVCVHPSHRGNGYVKQLVTAVHAWLTGRGTLYSVLFGDTKVYSSCGYRAAGNLAMDVATAEGPTKRQIITYALALPLGAAPWPEGEVYLPGPIF